ncbi:ABC transporter permease [Danxiaibacter flavus]|uniref:ABC transporter permease n=1 Tax=Danxiaibacter flavus TaxID=3049108 RepID=A0ABV3Z7U4_9BACT|nr:ABC transporter permease [Chitinophagaceae bacterium DXS]
MKRIRAIGALLLREAKIIAKDHSLLLTLLIAPLLYAFFYGSIYQYKEEENVKLAFVDDDNTSLSRMLKQQVSNLQMASVISVNNITEAKEMMYKGNCQGFIYVEKGLESKVLRLQQADVVLALNAARFLPSSDLLGAITQVSLTVSAGVRLKYFQTQGLTEQMAMSEVMPVNLDYRPLYNVRSNYGSFLLPGLLALILQQTLLIGLSGSVSGERQKRTVGSWLDISRNNLSLALYGKGAFYLLLFLCYAVFFLTVNFNILHLPVRGSVGALGFLMFLFLFTLIPMGVFIGSLFDTQVMNVQMMAFSTYPIFLITGYTFPLEALPEPVQCISSLLPTTPFIKSYISVVQNGATVMQNLPSIVHLLVLLLLYTLLAVWRIGKLSAVSHQLSAKTL